MPSDLIPFRTYATAAVLSLLVNVGAVGTFATFRFSGSSGSPGGFDSASASASNLDSAIAPLVLAEVTPEEASVPPTEDEKPPPPQDHTKPEPVVPPPPPPPPPRVPEEPRVKLGNPDAPNSESKVWLGVSKDAGALNGARGDFEQAEFKRGLPGAPSEESASAPSSSAGQPPGAPTPKSEPIALERATSEPGTERDAAPRDDQSFTPASLTPGKRALPAIPATDDPFAASLETAREATARLSRRILEAVKFASQPKQQNLESTTTEDTQARSHTLASSAPPTVPSVPDSPRPPSPPTATPSSTSASRSGQNGNGADRESDAFSKSTPVNVRPGQPLAGKGLAIKTVAPHWTTATRVLHTFRNPTVRLKFGRDGKVLRASYVDGKDAGHPDVSGPLLDAMYRWTAAGDELASIPPNDPQAGLIVNFHVILNN